MCVCVCVNNWTFALMLKPKKSKVLPVERESTRVWTRIAFQTVKIPSFRPSPIWRMVQLKLKICDSVFVCLDGSTWENIKGEAENSSCGHCFWTKCKTWKWSLYTLWIKWKREVNQQGLATILKMRIPSWIKTFL